MTRPRKLLDLSEEQLKRLEILAAYHGVSSSEYIRRLIDQAWSQWQPAIAEFTQPQTAVKKEPA